MQNLRRVFLGSIVALLVAGGCFAEAAHAQQFTLNRYKAAEKVDDGFVVARPISQGHLKFGVALHLDYANDPLVLEGTQGDANTELLSIVKNQLAGHLSLSLGLFDRAVISVGVSGNFIMDGDDETPLLSADGAGLGDATVALRLRLLGDVDDTLAIAIAGTVGIPTANMASGDMLLSGEDGLWGHPELLVAIRTSAFRVVANAGANIRKAENVPTVILGNELTFGVGVTVPTQLLGDGLDFHAEAFGATAFDDFGERESTPLEALLGLKAYCGNWAFGVASGMGLTRGVGSPDYRGVLMLGWQPRDKGPAVVKNVDSDGDGIFDADDACPMEPEDKDGFEDSDGCPDVDNDKDGVSDVDDGAPNDPEDKDEFEDLDGVPDPDNDGDGILDGDDECPNVAGTIENRGCPDRDRDGDGIVDRLDNCPDEPGTKKNQGCKAKQNVVIRDGSLEILDKVFFRTNKDVIRPRSFNLLRNVATVLTNHPEIKKIRVEGHTDSRGTRKHNIDLSKRRAKSVVKFLVKEGVKRKRLTSTGYGPDKPIVKNAKTKTELAQNRRVEFRLLGGGDDVKKNNSKPNGDTID